MNKWNIARLVYEVSILDLETTPQNKLRKIIFKPSCGLDKIDKLGNLEYDSNCSFCMDNPFTLDAIQTKKKLNEDKKLADKFVKNSDNLDSIINGLSHITAHKQQMDKCIDV